MANDSSSTEVMAELDRTIPGAYRSARGLELDGDAVAEAARRIDRVTGEVNGRPIEIEMGWELDTGDRDPHPDATFPVPGRRDFVDPDYSRKGGNPDSDYAPLVDFLPAPAVAAVARLVAAKHRARFPHLFPPLNQQVDYLWKRTGGESAGRTVLGKCVKVGSLAKYYLNATVLEGTWVIWIAADNCALITERQMEALVFHELLHTGINDKLKAKLRPHDVEEFRAVIEEYGFVFDDLRALKHSVQQRSLFERDADDERQEESA